MSKVARDKENHFSTYKLFAKQREDRDPAWLARLREKAGACFEQLDFPTTRHEEWKYTNVTPILKVPYRQAVDFGPVGATPQQVEPFNFEESFGGLLVFINGLFSSELSSVGNLTGGVIATNLAEPQADQAKIIGNYLAAYAQYHDDAFTALNTAYLADGGFIHIPDGRTIETPIHLLFISTASEPLASHPRVLIVAGRDSTATVIESYVSIGEEVNLTNAVTEVFTAEGATLTHYRLQEESERSFHIATTEIFQECNSTYSSCAISLGGEISRHTLNVTLGGEHAETTVDGLYVVTGRQHVDNHTAIDHRKPCCNSRQLYKGILDGRSRAVFNGKVFVREGSLLTDARQLNKNLLLSSAATVDTKPQLEIFADDVKCSHGATVGQLEDEELFYLATRGIRRERARALLTYGFAEDVISKINLRSIRERLEKKVLEKLHQSLEVE